MIQGALVFSLLSLSLARNFQPVSLNYPKLQDLEKFQEGRVDEVLEKALTFDGILAITGIPQLSSVRKEALLAAHACIMQAPKAMSHKFPDQTVRHTLAAASKATNDLQAIEHGSSSEACRDFDRKSLTLRQVVSKTVATFTERLNMVLDIGDSAELLQSAGQASYRTLKDIVNGGERLEHFHTYHLPNVSSDENTIDFHIDQGLFIAFVPALLVDHDSNLRHSSAGAFQIRTSNGDVEVDFPDDSLVIMAGDGMNQYLNNRHGGIPIHAPAHAFRVPVSSAGLSRVWFGLMQLPPADGVDWQTGLTFQQIRDQNIAATNMGEASALGCSRKLQAHNAQTECAENELYCWMRCMPLTDTVNAEACAEQDMSVNCTSQFDQIWLPQHGHGDYNPQCTTSTSLVTPRPPVEGPTGVCHGWDALVDDTKYAHRTALVEGQTYLLWNVVGDEVEAKMVHNGLVGWMAIGIENPGGRHNGMNGAPIVMGLNNPDIPSFSVAEYVIHPMASAWRHWKTPVEPGSISNAEFEVTGCHSSMQFRTKTISGWSLNVTSGNNSLIWALTKGGYVTLEYGGYAPYHAAADGNRSVRSQYRGKLHVAFHDGTAHDGTAEGNGKGDDAIMTSITVATTCPCFATLFVFVFVSLLTRS